MRLRFGDCVLDTGVRELTRGRKSIPLPPKAFRLLEVLAARRPDAISQDDLRRELWPDTVMGGTTIARLVSQVRTAIGDHGDEPIIRTVHRFGYAFAGTAAEEGSAAPTAAGGFAIQWGAQLVPLALGENLIGRSSDALITLPSSKVSRRHARLLVSGDRVLLEDLGSRNGTYVGEQRIESAVELKNGDRIGIGPALLIFCAAVNEGLTATQTGPRT